MNNKPKAETLRRLRQLDYIAQFSTDIRFVEGCENVTADALLRMEEIAT